MPRVVSLVALTALSTLATLTSAIDGTAQMTGGNLNGGTCMLDGYKFPPDIYGAALAGPNWKAGSLCGACLTIDGKKGNARVMIVDECPGCAENQVNLFEDVFKQVGDPSKGKIDIKWDIIYCGIKSPIILKNKTGSSRYWFEMQVRNCNQPVDALEVSTDNGKTWQATTRKDYNYFQKAGGGGGFDKDTVSVRISCMDGKKIVASNIGVDGDTEFPTNVNC